MSNKVILVVLDGLNYQVARDCMGYLNGLLEQRHPKPAMRATLYPVQSELPSMSRPLYECILTGIRPVESGIVNNDIVRLSHNESIFSFAKAQGKVTAAAALLGARTSQYWAKVALPVLSPALFGTFIILIANAIGAYASVYALTSGNYNIITIRIASLVSGDLFLEPNLAAAISVILMTLPAFITIINQWLISKSYAGRK